MIMRGSCSCNNICLSWRNIDFSLVPRKCGCNYCSEKSAAYVSKSKTSVEVEVRNTTLLRMQEHGSRLAKFYECANCGDVVIVIVSIDGELFCALNVNCLEQRHRFPKPINVNFSDQMPEQKLARWKQNWCHPVLVTSQASGDAVTDPLLESLGTVGCGLS